MAKQGKIIVVAAGNEGKNVDVKNKKYGYYPGSYDLPNIISVSNMAQGGGLQEGSNRGDSVDATAPGEDDILIWA